MDKLLLLTQAKEQVKVVTDMAFDAVDEDGSGGLDSSEIQMIMVDVAKKMGVTPPTSEDLDVILDQLDENFDGVIDKDEFANLVLLVLGKMLEGEEKLYDECRQNI